MLLLAILLVLLGLAATVHGVRLATERRRPVDLAGALLAAAGLALSDAFCRTSSSRLPRVAKRQLCRAWCAIDPLRVSGR
jgi:uncharacterized membrane protein YoaK (UPF0700 family)